jgi:RNA-directed DNA polymerase
MEDGAFHTTPTGTPQGGVISPLLLNVALHGMETALGVKRKPTGEIAGKRAVVRYADDFVVFCESQEDALKVKDDILPPWLAERGLTLSTEKTRVVHLTDGFDFLSFNVRHYKAPKTSKSGWKLLIKPSKKAVDTKRAELREEWLKLRGHSIQAVLKRLNPIIKGWANYHRKVVASEVFQQLDQWMFHRIIRYIRHMHPHKSREWCVERYWGHLNKDYNDNWVFGDKRSGRYLYKFRWFKIERHALVRGTASPDDPSLREYWWERRKISLYTMSRGDTKLAEAQNWKCLMCGMDLDNGEDIHRHHKTARADGGSDSYENRELVHLYCHQQITYRWQQQRRKAADE